MLGIIFELITLHFKCIGLLNCTWWSISLYIWWSISLYIWWIISLYIWWSISLYIWWSLSLSFLKLQLLGPLFQNFYHRSCNHCCKIEFFLCWISLMNSHQSILPFYINWGSTLSPKSIDIIKYSFVANWIKNIRVSEKVKWVTIAVHVSSHCQVYFLA